MKKKLVSFTSSQLSYLKKKAKSKEISASEYIRRIIDKEMSSENNDTDNSKSNR